MLGNERVPYHTALERAGRGEIPYPPALLRAVFHNRQDTTPSASTLSGCLRRFELKRQFGYYVPPEAGYASMLGSGAHAQLDKYAQDDPGRAERHLRAWIDLPDLPAPYNRLELAGTTDYVDEDGVPGHVFDEGGFIRDWKTTGAYLRRDFTGYPEHELQANVYHWLHSKQPGAKPLAWYEIVYVNAKEKQTVPIRGYLKPLPEVEAWIRARMHEWASYAARDCYPDVIPEWYESDPKARGACRYCEVADVCESEYGRGR